MRDNDHDGGREAAQERRAEEREDDLRQAGRFPYEIRDITVKPGDVKVWCGNAAGDFAQIPVTVPDGLVVRAGQRLGVLLDTDENGDLRGRVAVADDASSIEADDPSLSLRDMPDDLVGAILDEIGVPTLDHDNAPPDDLDEAVIRHATETVERPAPLLPAAELFFAAACKATSAVRADTTTTAGLEAAHRAARLAADLARRLEERLAAARDLRARQWPKECACSAVYDKAAWATLVYVGIVQEPDNALELRQCGACQSTIAMPQEEVSHAVR